MIIYYNTEFSGGRPESRRLLEKAFAKQLGDPALAGDLIKRIKTGKEGKPYIDGFSFFSVSHTGSIWAVLIDERECGLDIQLERDCNMQAIADRVYAAEDREILGQAIQQDGQAKDVFFRIWTRRETLAKALGDSAIKSDLPAVLGDQIILCGESGESREGGQRAWIIADIPAEEIIFAGTDRPDKKLYAAVCIESIDADEEADDLPEQLAWEQI